MKYSMNVISAAINEIAEKAMQEQNISDSDADGLGRVMMEAEEIIAKQLAREGMAMMEAEEMASNASMMPGRASAESSKLAEDAYFHRHSQVQQAIAPAKNEENPEVAGNNNQTDQNQPAQEDIAYEAEIAMPRQSLPSRPVTVRKLEPAPLKYEVVMKKVHEIFKGIDPSDKAFDFKVPFINWEKVHSKVPQIDPCYTFDVAHLHTFLYAVAVKASTNIVGPHGCGKTQAVKQIAARLNMPVTTLPMDGQLSRRELIGQEKLRATENGNESYFSEGLLPKALKEPGFILFDEVDRGISDLQYACHSVYLQEGLTILEDSGRFIPFHEYNRVFGTANTKGRGSMDGMYQAAEEMSEATRDRWSLWVEMDYPTADDDIHVLIQKTPGLEAEHAEIIAKIANEIREASKQGKLSQTCSMRQQLEVAKKVVFLCENETTEERKQKAIRHAFERVICGRASPEDQGAIESLLQIKIPQAYVGKGFFEN